MSKLLKASWLFPALAFIFFLLFIEASYAQIGDMSPLEVTTTLTLAKSVQNAIEGGNYAYLAVIAMMFGMQIVKTFFGSRLPSVREHAASYSAMGGAGIGAVMSGQFGTDPVSGAIGGAMAGNAASGLYSTAKSTGRVLKGFTSYLPLIFTIGVPAALLVAEAIKKSPAEKRKELMSDFDRAMKKANDKENPSTKELEQWFSKNL